MRKAILYILFPILFLANSWQAHAVAFPHNAQGKSAFQKETSVTNSLSDNTAAYHKDVLIDCADYDESDYEDNYHASAKEKQLTVTAHYTSDLLLPISFIAKPFCDKGY